MNKPEPGPVALAVRDQLHAKWNMMQLLLRSTGADAFSPTTFWENDAAQVVQAVLDEAAQALNS